MWFHLYINALTVHTLGSVNTLWKAVYRMERVNLKSLIRHSAKSMFMFNANDHILVHINYSEQRIVWIVRRSLKNQLNAFYWKNHLEQFYKHTVYFFMSVLENLLKCSSIVGSSICFRIWRKSEWILCRQNVQTSSLIYVYSSYC